MRRKNRAAYDPFAAGYTKWAETRGGDHFQDALDFLPDSARRGLDAGCGPGILSIQLADRVSQVVGLDISFSMVALAKERSARLHKTNVDFVVADLSLPPFKEGVFDCLACYNALRLASVELKVPKLRRLLREGGRMVIFETITSTSRVPGGLPLGQILQVFKSAPRYAKDYGFGTMWSILSFWLNLKWINYLRKSRKISPELFKDVYNRLLPGCRFKENTWRIIAFWEARTASDK